MTGPRRLIPWLNLVLLTVVAAAGLAVGLQQSTSSSVGFKQAVRNTIAAPNYTSETVVTGVQSETLYLVYNDKRLGGSFVTGGRRAYVAVIDGYEYESRYVAVSHNSSNLKFEKVPAQAASNYDPVHQYLTYAQNPLNLVQHGDVYSFKLKSNGHTLSISVTVTGQYVTKFVATAKGQSATVNISDIGTSPKVSLPPGAKVTTVPAPTGTGTTS